MHQVAAFEVDPPGPLLAALVGERAATLVTNGPHGLTSTILPLLYEPDAGALGTLTGHVARGNPIGREADAGEALVVLTGVEGPSSIASGPTPSGS